MKKNCYHEPTVQVVGNTGMAKEES